MIEEYPTQIPKKEDGYDFSDDSYQVICEGCTELNSHDGFRFGWNNAVEVAVNHIRQKPRRHTACVMIFQTPHLWPIHTMSGGPNDNR